MIPYLQDRPRSTVSLVLGPEEVATLPLTSFTRFISKTKFAMDLPSQLFLGDVGIVASPGSQRTFNYQLKGSDTLTIGDARCWIEGKTRRSLVEGHWYAGFFESHAMEYVVMLNTFGGQCAQYSSAWSRLDEIYSTRDARTVHGFLRTHLQLVDVLLEASPYLDKHFGPNPHVVLEVLSDPEVEGADELIARIFTSLPVEEAMARLDRLDEEWFLDQLDRVSGMFNLNLAFT